MKFFLENWYLFLAAIVSGGLLLRQGFGGTGAGRVSTAEAVNLINREKAVLIDVCEPAEFAAGHATGAKNVPLGSLETSKDLPKNKTLPVLLICPSGARASRAIGILKKLGYENVRAVAGGTGAWREAQLPLEKTA